MPAPEMVYLHGLQLKSEKVIDGGNLQVRCPVQLLGTAQLVGPRAVPIAPYAKDAGFGAAVWRANSRYHSMEGHIPCSWRFAAQGELRADGGGCGR
jgi:hypothetical protein